MAVSKPPPITPETSSGEGLDDEATSRGDNKWKRFHPLRVVRKIFRRRTKRNTASVSESSKKSFSTSELLSVHDENSGKHDTSPFKIGLSVSHDSIFPPEITSSTSSESLNVARGSSLTVHHAALNNMFKDELFSRVHARRDSDDDEDVGLPHSPCTSPTTVDILNQSLKEKSLITKTTHSAGSLFSMGSSEYDEDSAGHSSGHSSRMSLTDRRSADSDIDFEVPQSVPLNHNAAHHKIAIKPKRTHGLPRHRLNQIAAAKVITLPSTPEVIEDCIKTSQSVSKCEVQRTSIEHSSSSNSTVSNCHPLNGLMFEVHGNSRTCENIEVKTFNVLQVGLKNNLNACQNNIATFPEKTSNNGLMHGKVNANFLIEDKSLSILNMTNSLKETTYDMMNSEQGALQCYTEDDKGFDDVFSNVSSVVQNIERSDTLKVLSNDSHIKEEVKSHKQNAGMFNESKESTSLKYFHKEQIKRDSFFISNTNTHVSLLNESNAKEKPHWKNVVQQSPISSITEKSYEINLMSPGNVSAKTKIDISKNILLEKENTINNEVNNFQRSRSLSPEIENDDVSKPSSDMLVTEAHNFVAAQGSNEMYSKTSAYIENTTEDGHIHSVGLDGMHTANVSTDFCRIKHCDDKKAKEKVSVQMDAIANKANSSLCISSSFKKLQEVSNTNILSTSDRKKHIGKDIAPIKPSTIQKPLSDTTLNPVHTKNTGMHKRVSLEILSYDQRMTNRKNQLTMANEESLSGNDKSNSHTEREAKYAQQKSFSKQKELHALSDDHSFPISYVPDSKLGEVILEKQMKKDEKSEYPLKLQIQKSNFKENNSKECEQKCKQDNKEDSKNSKVAKNIQTKKSNLQGLVKTGKIEDENIAMFQVRIQQCSNIQNKDETNTTFKSTNETINSNSQKLFTNDIASLETKTGNQCIKNSENCCRVKKDSSKSAEPELLRVFARRSIKQKNCDKKTIDSHEKMTFDVDDSSYDSISIEESVENAEMINISKNSTVIKICETKPHFTKTDLKKKSKSFSDKEKVIPRTASPLKEMNLIHKTKAVKLSSDNVTHDASHRRQRISSIPDIPMNMSSDVLKQPQKDLTTENPILCNEEILPKFNTSISTLNGRQINNCQIGENNDILNGKEPHAPSWIQLAQQRREQREQRERLLLGGSNNSFLDAANKPARSSKVWDMVNNFQKLQMT